MPTLLIPNFSRTARYGFAIVVVVIAALLRQILSTALGAGVPFILFYPAVALAAWFGGFWPGVLSTVLGGFIAWYMFMPPYLSWMVFEASAAGQLTIFILASLFICLLAEACAKQHDELLKVKRRNENSESNIASRLQASEMQ